MTPAAGPSWAGDHALIAGLALLALAAVGAVGAVRSRAMLASALHLAVLGGALGAAAALLGAGDAGLTIGLLVGAICPILLIAAMTLVGRMARVRRDGPPLASMAVAAALALALGWAGLDLAPYGQAAQLADLRSLGAFHASLGAGALALAGMAALALLGFGERAHALRQGDRPARPARPKRRRKASEDDFS